MKPFIETVTVSGKKYKLQHPGSRAWLKIQQQMINAHGVLNLEPLFDYAFENVVIPEGNHPQLTLDDLNPWEMEAWGKILPPFLRGEKFSKPGKSGG